MKCFRDRHLSFDDQFLFFNVDKTLFMTIRRQMMNECHQDNIQKKQENV